MLTPRKTPVLCCLFVVAALVGCRDDDDEMADSGGETDAATSPDPDPSAGEPDGGECPEQGMPCACPDGSQSALVCAPDLMCWCPEDEPTGGEQGECGTSVPLGGAFEGTFDDSRCGIGNSFGDRVSFAFGALLEPELLAVTVPLDDDVPVDGAATVTYTNMQVPDVNWSTPDGGCSVTIASVETVMDRPRVTGSVTCDAPAVAEGQAELTIGDFEFVGEIWN